MRVALVILHADPARGGAERYTLQLADALLAADHDVTLLSADADTGASITNARRVRMADSGPIRTVRYWAFCRSLARHVRETNYDIVHSMLPVPPGMCDLYQPHAGVAARRTSPFYTRWINPRRRLYARLERRMLESERSPVVLTLSQLVEDELLAHYPAFPVDRTARLFNAADLARFGPHVKPLSRPSLGLENDDVAALFVANNFALKGLSPLLTAMVNHPRLTLLVVGGDDPRAMQALAQRLGVAGRVRWLGARGDLPALYRTVDFLVLPTRRDSCSLVVLEALASGLPVITTRTNGASEIMADGEHGFVINEPHDRRLARTLELMLDPKLRARMAQACTGLRPSLSWERHLQTLLEIYECRRNPRGNRT